MGHMTLTISTLLLPLFSILWEMGGLRGYPQEDLVNNKRVIAESPLLIGEEPNSHLGRRAHGNL
jgi:hypothetical protein